MAPKKTLVKKDKTKTASKTAKVVEQPVEPTVTLTEVAVGVKDEGGMISPGGVEIIGLLGLVTLIYGTALLYLLY